MKASRWTVLFLFISCPSFTYKKTMLHSKIKKALGFRSGFSVLRPLRPDGHDILDSDFAYILTSH